MNSPPPPFQPPPPPPSLESPLSNQIFPMELPSNFDEPSSTAFEWASLLDFNFEDQFNIPWTPDNRTRTVDTTTSLAVSGSVSDISNRDGGGSDGSEKIRKRDPRLTCENFLAGRIPCSCPELDEKDEEEVEVGKKRQRKVAGSGLIRCQVPGCEVDISELKGYHKRHRVCLRCANSTSVVLDGQHKRYCQQCGKFHILPDFDEGKRSCRRKLERHNRRRRKLAESKGGVGMEIQVDQLAEDVACEDKADKDETPNESEDGDVSPVSSQPGSQSIQSGSIKSFVTLGETQTEGGKNNSKCSSFAENKNAYSSMCPTGRISFKLYDWNPAEFPRRLRHQIFQWLASMPVELEGYIRPGCTILTVFIAMPHFMWEKFFEDAGRHIHDFVNAPESMLFGRGAMTVYLNDMIFRVLRGTTSIKNVKMEVLAPRLHYVYPSCFEAGKPMEFVACGSNLLHSRFRFLVSFSGRYLAYDDCLVIPCGKNDLCSGTNEESWMQCEHQSYKIYISSTDATLSGPAFVEVESEYGISNFIPVLFGDMHVCSEMKIVQQRLDDALFPKESRNVAVNAMSQPCQRFILRQTAMSELLLDIGWLLKEPKLDDVENHLTFTQIQRFNCLLSFLIQNESRIVLERILCSLKTIMDTKSYYCDSASGDAEMMLFQKILEHARGLVHPRLQDTGEQVLRYGSSVEKADYWFECYGENEMPVDVQSNEDMKAKKKSLGCVTSAFQESDEAAPLLNKEIIMNFTHEPHQVKVLPQQTCSRFRSTTLVGGRSLFLMATAAIFCFGICAVFLHPNKVGEFAVSIRRCMFGSTKT